MLPFHIRGGVVKLFWHSIDADMELESTSSLTENDSIIFLTELGLQDKSLEDAEKILLEKAKEHEKMYINCGLHRVFHDTCKKLALTYQCESWALR